MIGKALMDRGRLRVITDSGVYDMEKRSVGNYQVKEGDIVRVKVKNNLAEVYGNESRDSI